MTREDFINKIVGTQYINRGYDYDGCDCWGLCYLYYRDVEGAIPKLTDSYINHDEFSIAFASQLSEWDEIEQPEEGACVFVCFNGEVPTHCGIMLDKGRVLHSFGDPRTDRGQVTVWKFHQMKRYLQTFYGECVVRFYKWRSLS